MRFGGVFVMMSTPSSRKTANSGTATQTLARSTGLATIQPSTPPARASTTAPSLGCGAPSAMWHRALTLRIMSPRPMPMRVLSCTLAGWRNSHAANRIMMTGRAKATRPSSPPNVHASSAIATGSVARNHSTIAPTIASRTMRNGMPSRRSSFARVSRPSIRNRPPVAWAMPIQITVRMPGSALGGGRRFVACVREDPPREPAPDFGRAEDARDDAARVRDEERVEAMRPRYPRGATGGPPTRSADRVRAS